MAQIDDIIVNKNEDEKEASLKEQAQALSTITVNVGSPSYCYFTAPACVASQRNAPIIYSGAISIFDTSDEYLNNARNHTTPITTANGKQSFTKSSGKLNLANSRRPIYLSALSAPEFTQNLISVGQLASKHDVLFAKKMLYTGLLSCSI